MDNVLIQIQNASKEDGNAFYEIIRRNLKLKEMKLKNVKEENGVKTFKSEKKGLYAISENCWLAQKISKKDWDANNLTAKAVEFTKGKKSFVIVDFQNESFSSDLYIHDGVLKEEKQNLF